MFEKSHCEGVNQGKAQQTDLNIHRIFLTPDVRSITVGVDGRSLRLRCDEENIVFLPSRL